MPWLTLIENTEDQGVALIGEKDLDGIVCVSALGKKLQLGSAGLLEKFELGSSFRERNIAVAFLYQELLQHLVSKSQARTCKRGPVLPTITATAQVVAASLRELCPHRHMRLGRGSFLSGVWAFVLPFFHKSKFVVLQQGCSKFGQK